MKRLSLLLLLPALVATARAQSATVFGTVNEIVGDRYYPIAFARVSLSGGQFSTRPVVPDIDGEFSFEAVPAGVYELRVAAVGFASLSREVEVAPGDSLRVRVRLGDPDIAGIMVEPAEGYAGGQRLGGADE